MGGWVGQMMMFDDKVGGWGWLNDDVIKKYTRKKNFCLRAQKTRLYFFSNFFLCSNFFMSIFFLCNSQGDSLKTNLATVPRDYELIQVTDFFSGKMNQNYYVACSFFSIKTSPF